MFMKIIAAAAGFAAFGSGAALSAEVRARVMDREGNALGTVSVADTSSGTAHVLVSLSNVSPGVHAIHLHETGDCSADDFTSAGGHIAGDAMHGVQTASGPHPGDTPNATVQADGALQVEHFLPDFDVTQMLMDGDGAAFVMHEGADDYESQPAGDAGSRIACGEF